MKKIFTLTITIGMFLLILMMSHPLERVSGAANNASIGVEEQNGIEQIGPPWLDAAWHYRRPVIISSSAYIPTYYQVLIKLDNSNFNFNLSNTNGSDIRFTDSSGKNLISYWIESWDNQNRLAYIWVLVSTIPPQPYNKTIYLYYNNPNAIPASNGSSTFDFFDDFIQFSDVTCSLIGRNQNTEPFSNIEKMQDGIISYTNNWVLTDPWCVIIGSPSVSSSILTLSNATGIKTNNLFQPQEAVGYLANYGSGSGHEWIGFINGMNAPQTVIGDLQSDPNGLYLINFANDNSAHLGVNNLHDTNHVYEVRWSNGVSTAYLDHTQQGSNSLQVPTGNLPLSLYNNNSGSVTNLKVDWLYVRQYSNPEPTAIMGTEQGLVDLRITMSDSPDPLPKNKELSYQITVTNTSSIDAPGVVVTDTLPESVEFIRADPSIGCNHIAQNVVCNLNTITANSTANETIVVIPTADGYITNTVTVGSPGYELDLSNNTNQAKTLVDSIPPNVNWENPVHNGQKYITNGGMVGLEASATDNDQVTWVEFWYWDHLPLKQPRGKVSIGIDYSYPYQMQFNSDVLVSNEEYQVFVQAADRAGNISSIYQYPYPVFYIKRIALFFLYLPIAIK